MVLGLDRHRGDTETRSQYPQKHPHRGTDHHRAVRVHELDVYGGVDDVGDGKRAGGRCTLGGPGSTGLDGLRDTARRGIIDFRLRAQRTIRRVQALLRRGQGWPRTTCFQLCAYGEDDTGRCGGVSGRALASMPAAGQHNRPDRVRQFPYVGVLWTGDGVAHYHATNETRRSSTVRRAYRDTLASARYLNLPRGATDSSRTVGEVSLRAHIHPVRYRRIPYSRIQEDKEYCVG